MRVLFVGAGMAGLTLAGCLERNGDEAIVLERSLSLRGAGYMIDFFGSGYDAAERLGLLSELDAIRLRFGSTIESFAQQVGGIEATLSDGSKEQADLLVGADGVHSKVRRLAFGAEKLFVRQLGYHTAAFVFDDPRDAGGNWRCLRDADCPWATGCALPDPRGKGRDVLGPQVGRRPPRCERRSRPKQLRELYGGLGWLMPKVLERTDEAKTTYLDTVAQ